MTTSTHYLPRHQAVFIPSPVPFLFAGVAVFAVFGALGFMVTHPFLLLLGLWFVAHRASRRHGRRWARGWHHQRSARAEAFRVACGDMSRQARSPKSARASYQRARDAVQNSATLSDAKKESLLKTLSAGLDEVASLDDARRRLDRFDDVAGKAEEKAAKFEADCDKLSASLAALEIQDSANEALDELGAAVDELADRIDASAEVDGLAD